MRNQSLSRPILWKHTLLSVKNRQDNHHVYSAMHKLPDSLYESKEFTMGSTIWKIRKDRIEEIARILHLDKADYPYMTALEMIDGDYFWIIAWDD